MIIPSKIFDPLLPSLQFLDLSNNRWNCEPENQWLISFVHQNNVKNQSISNQSIINHGFINDAEDTRCWLPLEFRSLSLLDINPESMKPYVEPTLAPLDWQNPVDSNIWYQFTTGYNIFGNYTLPAIVDNQPDLAKFAFGTLAPKSSAPNDKSSIDPKTLVISIVFSGIVLTIVTVVVVVYLMKKRRRAKKTDGQLKKNSLDAENRIQPKSDLVEMKK